MDEQSDYGSKLEDLSLGILGKISDKYLTGTPTAATPTSPQPPMTLAIPSATNQSIGFLSRYRVYLIAGAIGIVAILFIWRKK